MEPLSRIDEIPGAPAARLEEILAVVSAASQGDLGARVRPVAGGEAAAIPERLGSLLNVLLDDVARRVRGAERAAERLRILGDVTRALAGAAQDDQSLLRVLVQRLSELGGDLASIRILEPDGQLFETCAPVHHPDPAIAAAGQALAALPQSVGAGVMGRVAATGEAIFIPHVDTALLSAATLPAYRDFLEQVGVTSLIAVPLKRSGVVIGVATLLRSDRAHPFTEDDLRLVESIAEHAALLIANARSSAAERAATERLSEARANELILRGIAAIVDSSDDAIIGETLDGIVTSWNGGAQRLFGYAPDEMIGQPLGKIFPPGSRRDERAILVGLAQGQVERFDALRRTKDGRDIQVSVSISPVRDASGKVIGASKVVRDVTERRRAEDALARAKDAAEAANRELEAFSHSVAHDLRAPLRGMQGFARLLLDDYGTRLGPEAHDWMQEILLNGRKMSELIDALIALSRLTRIELRSEYVDLSALARATGRQLTTMEPERTVELAVEDGLGAVMDPALARSLFENLLGNSWKFTRQKPKPRVEVGSFVESGTRTFYVRDDGAGFDMAYAGKLFGPFQRLHTQQEFPGSGIGLASVQRIVHRHGGRIRAEGRVGEGATFYFTLPTPGAAP